MEGMVGDRMIVNSRRINQAPRVGEIVEVLRAADGRASHYRVRWSDGRESVMFPGCDASVEHVTRMEESAPGTEASEAETRTVSIELVINEDRERCEAKATMHTMSGTFTGTGTARRNPVDPVVPMIGEELAAARSLANLAAKLEEAAGMAIAAHESRPLRMVQ
ncbi:MAG TPA: dsRBD fold-containing protein [Acidimicrobiales bacterium]|jgi:hypothetical protein|nr:dsRBD fold-containing protein [Acidimicrobiales bacterium]